MRWIGPIGWIRRWIGRHWCRDLGELRRQVERAANDGIHLRALQGQIEGVQGVVWLQRKQLESRDATIRELTKHNTRSLAEMAAAHKKLLAEDLGRIRRTVELVCCRLDALAERMELGAGEATPKPKPDGVDDTWKASPG